MIRCDLSKRVAISIFLAFFTLFLFIAPADSLAAQAKLAWGSVTPSPDGYRIYKRIKGQSYDFSKPSWTGTTTSCTVSNLSDNTTYYFVARAYIGSNVSSNSNEVEFINYTSSPSPDPVNSGSAGIIDTGSAGTSSTGQWLTSGGANPYGSKSLYSKDVGATYTFTSSISGTYDVEMWWTYWASRCTNVPVKIYDGSTLLETVYVNQKQDGGQWNFLGPYDFSGQARVVVVATNSSCSTCADAVEFTKSTNVSGGSTSSGSTSSGSSSSDSSNCSLGGQFETVTAKVSQYLYTDRTYTITGGVPSWMVGRKMIQTPNDERNNKSSSGYIRFTTPVSYWVYVLFDSRSSSVPDWLGGWERYTKYPNMQTSLGSQPGLKFYRKMVNAGECVDLGGNYGPGSSSETRSNYVVVYGK
jgi:hypothetical protein